MTLHEILRLVAGTFVLVSLTLGYFVDPRWFLFTALVGLNLFQSAFSDWCPLMYLLRRVQVPECRHIVKS